MNIISVFISCLILQLNFVEGEYFQPLVLSVQRNYFQLDTFENLKNSVLQKEPGSLLKSVLCCPDNTIDNVVRQVIAEKSDFIDSFVCSQKYVSSIRLSEEPVENFTTKLHNDFVVYESGYKVCDQHLHLSERNFPLLKDDGCDFFHILKILYNKSNSSVEQVRYKLLADEHPKQVVKECDNFKLEVDIILVNIPEAYSQINENEILKNVEWWEWNANDASTPPVVTNNDVCNDVTRGRLSNAKNADRLKAQPLALKHHFSDESFGLPTCTHLNTVPMWEKVADVAWKNVQNYVQKVAIGTDNKIEIITGTYGVFKYISSKENSCQVNELYLLPKVPVPELFWTVLLNRLAVPNKSDATYYHYGSIILTINGTLTRQPAEICDVVKCEWNKHRFDVRNSSLQVFCCAFTEKNLQQLQINITESGSVVMRSLNLSEFYPHTESLLANNPINVDDIIGRLERTEERQGLVV